MLLWLSMLGMAEANDVLVPHITAVELDDFAVASEIEDMLSNEQSEDKEEFYSKVDSLNIQIFKYFTVPDKYVAVGISF